MSDQSLNTNQPTTPPSHHYATNKTVTSIKTKQRPESRRIRRPPRSHPCSAPGRARTCAP
jgi:hypothetical protein